MFKQSSKGLQIFEMFTIFFFGVAIDFRQLESAIVSPLN